MSAAAQPAPNEHVATRPPWAQARFESLQAELKLRELKIQQLTLELAHHKRLRFGVKSEALSPEQRDLFPMERTPPATILTSRNGRWQRVLSKAHGGNDNFYVEVRQKEKQAGKGRTIPGDARPGVR